MVPGRQSLRGVRAPLCAHVPSEAGPGARPRPAPPGVPPGGKEEKEEQNLQLPHLCGPDRPVARRGQLHRETAVPAPPGARGGGADSPQRARVRAQVLSQGPSIPQVNRRPRCVPAWSQAGGGPDTPPPSPRQGHRPTKTDVIDATDDIARGQCQGAGLGEPLREAAWGWGRIRAGSPERAGLPSKCWLWGHKSG